MASKKSKGNRSGGGASGVPAWLGVAVALLIAGAAAFALLTVQRGADREPEAVPKLSGEPESPTQHDRDQIDQASRDQLRDILRAADNGDAP